MLFGQLFGLLHVKEPHDSFLTVLVITGVNSLVDQRYSFGLKNLRRNTLLQADAIVKDWWKTSIFAISKTPGERHDRLVV